MGKLTTLSGMQLDAIGEIMNISMGSAATAVSELLNAKVWITTPKVTVVQASELNYDRLRKDRVHKRAFRLKSDDLKAGRCTADT